jgi:hypothetical protein
MADYLQLAAQMRAQREQEQRERSTQASQGGAATTNGGMIGQPSHSGSTFTTASQGPQNPQSNPLQQGLDAYSKYKDASQLFAPSAGSSLGATGTAYAGSGLGGTGYGLGSSLVAGGGSGAGASAGLGSMLGTYGGGSAAGGAGGFGALGSTTSGGVGGLLGGAGAQGGSSLGGMLGGGGGAAGGSAGGGLGGGAAAGGGMLAGLAALSYLGDKEMNENKGSIINADKLNDAGTIGGSGIGIRFGDFANAFNPATWLSDPKKAGKGIVNAFTLGFLDKFM